MKQSEDTAEGLHMLKGKKALITGGSRGIGRAIAIGMAREGADIAIIYAGNEEAANSVCKEAQKIGVKAFFYRCDVSKEDDVLAAIPLVMNDLGGLDILVNNAGIVRDSLLPMMKESDFTSVIDTNLLGAYHLIRHTCRHFIKQRSGRMINISSVVGLSGNAGQANYAAAKAGLIGLTKSCAKEFASRGITCKKPNQCCMEPKKIIILKIAPQVTFSFNSLRSRTRAASAGSVPEESISPRY